MSAVAKIVQEASTAFDVNHGFTSITGDDFATKAKVYSAVSESKALADNLGVTINLKDILSQNAEKEDKDTGAISEFMRITLIDVDGTSYAAGSKGLTNSVNTMLNVFGHPSTWPTEGIPVKAVEEKATRGKFFKLVLV